MYSIAFIILCGVILYREITFMHERKRWETERKDLYSRIQAGTLSEYKTATTEHTVPVFKTREQRVAEETERLGIQRSDLQFPSHWRL